MATTEIYTLSLHDALPISTGRTLDPLATLAFLAAATRRVGLGTAVLNLPFRPALLTAKWVATVQDLSGGRVRSEEHTSELQSRLHLVCRLLLEKKKKRIRI